MEAFSLSNKYYPDVYLHLFGTRWPPLFVNTVRVRSKFVQFSAKSLSSYRSRLYFFIAFQFNSIILHPANPRQPARLHSFPPSHYQRRTRLYVSRSIFRRELLQVDRKVTQAGPVPHHDHIPGED